MGTEDRMLLSLHLLTVGRLKKGLTHSSPSINALIGERRKRISLLVCLCGALAG